MAESIEEPRLVMYPVAGMLILYFQRICGCISHIFLLFWLRLVSGKWMEEWCPLTQPCLAGIGAEAELD